MSLAAASRWVPIFSRAGARMLAPYAARAVGRAARAAAPVAAAAAAVRGARGLRAGSRKRPAKSQKVKRMKRRVGRVQYSSMAGRVRRGSKKANNVYLKYLRKGVIDTQQISGIVSDPDCVYISVGAIAVDASINTLAKALVRKLVNMANVYPTDCDSPIPFEGLQGNPGSANNTGRFTVIVYDNNNNTIAQRVLLPSDSITAVAGGIQAAFNVYAAGSTPPSNNNFISLHRMVLRWTTFDTMSGVETPNSSVIASLMLQDEYVDILTTTNIKLQNRTLADDNSTETTNITVNPIEGVCYATRGVPKPRPEYLRDLSNIPVDSGIRLVRAAQMLTSARTQPPEPRVFQNLRSTRKLYIDPGKIKTDTIYFSKRQSLLNWLKSIQDSFGSYGAQPSTVTSPVPHHVFSFKDVINIATGNNITVCYEVTRKTAIMLSSSKNHTIAGQMQITTYNNTL